MLPPVSNERLAPQIHFWFNVANIAGLVASLTEGESCRQNETAPTLHLVNRDNAPWRAWRRDVQSDVGKLFRRS